MSMSVVVRIDCRRCNTGALSSLIRILPILLKSRSPNPVHAARVDKAYSRGFPRYAGLNPDT